MTLAAKSIQPRPASTLVTYFEGDLIDRANIRVSLRGNLRTGILYVHVQRGSRSDSSSFPAELTATGLGGEDVQRAFVLARSLHLKLGRPRKSRARSQCQT